MVSIASLLVRLLMVTITVFFATTTSILSFIDRHERVVCIHGGRNGYYNYACSNGTLSSKDVQVDVMVFARNRLYDSYLQGNFDVCTSGTFGGTAFSVYGGCRYGLDSVRCDNCMQNATIVVYQNCLGTVAAQAVSESCCIRYDRDSTVCT